MVATPAPLKNLSNEKLKQLLAVLRARKASTTPVGSASSGMASTPSPTLHCVDACVSGISKPLQTTKNSSDSPFRSLPLAATQSG
eukprot:12451519-Alexandrium_andersonii.AAC.1